MGPKLFDDPVYIYICGGTYFTIFGNVNEARELLLVFLTMKAYHKKNSIKKYLDIATLFQIS